MQVQRRGETSEIRMWQIQEGRPGELVQFLCCVSPWQCSAAPYPRRLSLTQITDSAGHILYAKEDATKGKFAFTTEDYDMFEACFESKLPVGKCPLASDEFGWMCA